MTGSGSQIVDKTEIGEGYGTLTSTLHVTGELLLPLRSWMGRAVKVTSRPSTTAG